MILEFVVKHVNKGIALPELHLCEATYVILRGLPPSRRMKFPFKRNRPSPEYLRTFRKRQAEEIKFGKTLLQEEKRFRSVNMEALTTDFATVERYINDNHTDASRIFNLDEVGVTPDREVSRKLCGKRLMPREGVQDLTTCEFSYENRVTKMLIINVSGKCCPPLFVVKGRGIPYRTVLRSGAVYSKILLCQLPRH